MKRAVLFVVVALGVSVAVPAAEVRAEAAAPSAVTQWIELELSTIASHRLNPPRASRELAHLSAAMYLAALAGTWRTWNLRSGSQFRPGPPPVYGSRRFLAEMNEVYAVSQPLTAEQKRIADFWADGAGMTTPPGHWNTIAADLVECAGLSTLSSARHFAVLNTAQADAFIACWDAKFAYWSLRPVTAIRRLIDANWLSYIVTPPFPSYVSGHSTTSGAASTVLAGFLPATRSEARCSRRGSRGVAALRGIGKVALHAYRGRAQPASRRGGSPRRRGGSRRASR
jgi:hypothetical protein